MPASNYNASAPNASQSADDYYAVLGVDRTATTDEINCAYRKLAKRHHPDRLVGRSMEEQQAAADIFKKTSEAHAVLSDSDKRRHYDVFGASAVQQDSAGDAAAQAMFEEMMGLGKEEQKQRRVHGGAMFVDNLRGHFYQRTFDPEDLDQMKHEMRQGLPEFQANEQVVTTTLPHGAWDIRLIDIDAERRVVTAFLCAARTIELEDGAPPCQLERTFIIPVGADVEAIEVSINETGTLIVNMPSIASRLTCPIADSSAAKVDENQDTIMPDVFTAEIHRETGNVPESGDAGQPLFVLGEEPAPPAPAPRDNRAARRRAKQEGLKAGFLNGKSRRSSGTERKASPISVREELEEAMRLQVDELATNERTH